MSLYLTIPTYMLLLTGYFCKDMQVAAGTNSPSTIKTLSNLSHSLSTSKIHLTKPTSKPGPPHVDDIPAGAIPNPLVAALSISLVFICIIVAVCIYCAVKRSRKGSIEINSDPSGEAELSFKNIKA